MTSCLPQIYTLDQIEAVISNDSFELELMDAMEACFVSYSQGDFNAAPIQTLGCPPLAPFSVQQQPLLDDAKDYAAQTCVKSGYVTGDDTFVIKVASGGHPLPRNTGLLQVYSQKTGQLETLLLDEGILTEHRTAAAGAVAAKYLAPFVAAAATTPIVIGVLGTGVQARFQLRYLKHVVGASSYRPTVRVWGRNTEHAAQFQREVEQEGFWKVELADSANQLLETCDLIVTTTPAREALLTTPTTTKRRRPQHITCIGADAPGKQELDPRLVAAADLLVADCRVQTAERGEFQKALAADLVRADDVMELGHLIAAVKGTKSKAQAAHMQQPSPSSLAAIGVGLTIFDSSGVAVQDCAVAKLVSRLLRQPQEAVERTERMMKGPRRSFGGEEAYVVLKSSG